MSKRYFDLFSREFNRCQKEKIALQRTEAVAAEVTAQVGTKVARQELEDRILWRKVQYNVLFVRHLSLQ